MNIGFIGLGIMGSAMAANLLKAGLKMTVWNRSADKCQPLAAAGARVGDSPRAVAEASDLVLAMMSTPAAVAAVRDGETGLLAGLRPGAGYVDLSTVDAETTQQSARRAHAKGCLFLEAPVAGSRKPAQDATLTIMTAGDRELYDRSLPVLEKLGKKILFLGDAGNAARMKIANNLVMGGMMTALAEGLALVAACKLDPAQLLEILDSGAVANPMFRLKGEMMVRNTDYPAAFPLKHMQKDLRLALQLGDQVGQPLFATAAVNELYKAALTQNHGDSDFAAIAHTVRK